MSTGRIDFVRSRRSPPLGWVLFGLGLVVLLSSLWVYHLRQLERVQRDAQAEERERASEKARQAAMRPAKVPLDERRLQSVSVEMNRPWLQTLRTVENVTADPIFLLSMTIDPVAGRVQLDGEAGTFDQALDYAQRLGGAGGLIDAHLSTHEQVASPQPGSSIVKFTVVGLWRAR